MRFVVAILILLFGAAFFVYPPLLEDTDSECSALELRVADLASHDGSGRLSVGTLYGSSSSNPSGAAYAKDHYPLLPPAAGCVIAYWKTVFSEALPASRPAPSAPTPSGPQPPAAPAPRSETRPPTSGIVSVVARGITLNGDPISPATTFTLPMDSVAIRVDDPGGKASAVRFQLLQGRAVLSSCDAKEGAAGTAWCKFNVNLRKGVYSIAATADHALLGQPAFSVIGR